MRAKEQGLYWGLTWRSVEDDLRYISDVTRHTGDGLCVAIHTFAALSGDAIKAVGVVQRAVGGIIKDKATKVGRSGRVGSVGRARASARIVEGRTPFAPLLFSRA